MYKFNTYWTDELKINFLQRVILINSYLYYEQDSPKISDRLFDSVENQLVYIQNKHSQKWITQHTQYGYAFYDFDGSTGFDLFSRLTDKDKEYIVILANMITRGD